MIAVGLSVSPSGQKQKKNKISPICLILTLSISMLSVVLMSSSEIRWGSLEELIPQPHVSSHNDNTSWSCLRRHKQAIKGKITHTFAFITLFHT